LSRRQWDRWEIGDWGETAIGRASGFGGNALANSGWGGLGRCAGTPKRIRHETASVAMAYWSRRENEIPPNHLRTTESHAILFSVGCLSAACPGVVRIRMDDLRGDREPEEIFYSKRS
jgi:hypothetical protein